MSHSHTHLYFICACIANVRVDSLKITASRIIWIFSHDATQLSLLFDHVIKFMSTVNIIIIYFIIIASDLINFYVRIGFCVFLGCHYAMCIYVECIQEALKVWAHIPRLIKQPDLLHNNNDKKNQMLSSKSLLNQVNWNPYLISESNMDYFKNINPDIYIHILWEMQRSRFVSSYSSQLRSQEKKMQSNQVVLFALHTQSTGGYSSLKYDLPT